MAQLCFKGCKMKSLSLIILWMNELYLQSFTTLSSPEPLFGSMHKSILQLNNCSRLHTMRIQTATALNRCVSPPETLWRRHSKLRKRLLRSAGRPHWWRTASRNISPDTHPPHHHHHCMYAQMLQSFVVVVSCSFPSEVQFSQRSIKGDGKYTKYVAW